MAQLFLTLHWDTEKGAEHLHRFQYSGPGFRDQKHHDFHEKEPTTSWPALGIASAGKNLMRTKRKINLRIFTRVSEVCVPLHEWLSAKQHFAEQWGSAFCDISQQFVLMF